MRHTILIVEDNPMNLALAEQILEDDYELLSAEDGSVALKTVEATIPHLILMDLSMPILDGWETLTRLRADERFANIPVIALSAHALLNEIDRALAHGFNAFVTKPIDDDELLRVVAELLAS